MMRALGVIVAAGLTLSACTNGSRQETAASPSAATEKKSIAGSKGNEGWYSADQAAQGAVLFKQKCEVCHGANLQGGAGPALAGNQFFLRYKGKPLGALWSTIHTEMPLTAPATLTDPQSLALVAFILQKNGFPAGPSPIIGHYDIARIIPDAAPGAVASGEAGQSASAAPMVVKQPSTGVPTQQELDASDEDAGNWLTYGKGYRGARYSTLSDITTANVRQLKPVCSVELAPEGSFEASPIAYSGTLYITTTNGTFAVNGENCAKIWGTNTTQRISRPVPITRA